MQGTGYRSTDAEQNHYQGQGINFNTHCSFLSVESVSATLRVSFNRYNFNLGKAWALCKVIYRTCELRFDKSVNNVTVSPAVGGFAHIHRAPAQSPRKLVIKIDAN